MLLNRGWTVGVAAGVIGETSRAGPGCVSRHRPRRNMLPYSLILIVGTAFLNVPILAFRGPHHPKSSVSHHHYVPDANSVKITQDEQLLHDASHLAEDMGSLAEQIDLSKMTPQELEFYYFKVHDIDNNTKLDGLELFHALQHTLHGDNEANKVDEKIDKENLVDHENSHYGESVLDNSWIIELIDRVLEEDDLDNDGYLCYIEYVLGRQKDQDERVKRDVKLKIGTNIIYE